MHAHIIYLILMPLRVKRIMQKQVCGLGEIHP